jgi:hypothetical protein
MNPLTEVLKRVWLGEIQPSRWIQPELMKFIALHQGTPKEFLVAQLPLQYAPLLEDFCTDPKTELKFPQAYLRDTELLQQLQKLEQDFLEGKEVSVFEGVQELLEELQESGKQVIDLPRYSLRGKLNIRKIDAMGIPWGIPLLDEDCKPIEAGDATMIAARKDMGKSALAATLATSAIKAGKKVLWGNNESKGSRILSRFKHLADAPGDLVIYDIHGQNVGMVEKLIKEETPDVVVVDMLDHVNPLKLGASTADKVEQVAIHMRNLAAKHGFWLIHTAQLAEAAKDQDFPSDSDIHNNKTGKPGAVDTILLIGGQQQGQERFLSIGKNKEGQHPSRRGVGYNLNGTFRWEKFV